jgi:hypothetical protein
LSLPFRPIRSARFVVAFAALLAIAAHARLARAAASARLVYARAEAAEGCPDEAGLRRAIAERVGYDPIFPIAPNAIVVTLTRKGERLFADVKLVSPDGILSGVRSLEARVGRCEELVAAIALTIGISLDQIERAPPPPPPADEPVAEPLPAADPPATPPVEKPSPPPDSVPPRESGESPVRVELAAGFAGWLGTAPAASLGPTLLASIRWRAVSFAAEGRLELPASAPSGALPNERARTSLVGGGPLVCLHVDPFFTCGVAFVGSLSAEAPGVPGATQSRGLDVLAGLRAGVALPLGGPFSARASVDVLGNVRGPTVRALDETLWRPGFLAGGAQLALAVTIP